MCCVPFREFSCRSGSRGGESALARSPNGEYLFSASSVFQLRVGASRELEERGSSIRSSGCRLALRPEVRQLQMWPMGARLLRLSTGAELFTWGLRTVPRLIRF